MAGRPTIKLNGQTFTESWVNDIVRWIDSLVGAGGIVETDFTVANNQVAAADVTGLLFSSAVSRSAVASYDVRRKTDTGSSEVRATGTLVLGYRLQTAAWEILGQDEYGDAHGVTFTVTSAGQVQYTSTSIAGSNYVGQLKFKAEAFNA